MKSVSNHSLAVFGGTFDPVHIGHLRIAIRLREAGFERVLMVPNRQPPHRDQPGASGAQRLAMLNLAIADIPAMTGITASDIELTQDGPSYSARTVEQIRQRAPEQAITWVMGTDAWNGFDRWHQPDVILDHANLLVISRPGETLRRDGWLGQQLSEREAPLSQLFTQAHGGICLQAWPELDISASDLRQAILRGDNTAFLTPESVQNYIEQHSLYK